MISNGYCILPVQPHLALGLFPEFQTRKISASGVLSTGQLLLPDFPIEHSNATAEKATLYCYYGTLAQHFQSIKYIIKYYLFDYNL